MADENLEDDLFADLYDADEAPNPAPSAPVTLAVPATVKEEISVATGSNPESQDEQQSKDQNLNVDTEQRMYKDGQDDKVRAGLGETEDNDNGNGLNGDDELQQSRAHGAGSKEDGKMFIGGLSWETSDESLKEYFSQYGEVAECTVMRDPASGRSRGFGFLTFRDAKTVNSVMVKEHFLDGKIIDPKRAIPRDEQEKTSKIFVGGVSQEASETDFREYFMQFGRVIDATLMIDKDTGRPRGFGFVTFDSEAAVDMCLSQPLEIHGKPIEVKKAQPRGNMREDDESNRGNNQRAGFKQGGFQKRQDEGNHNNGGNSNQNAMANNLPAGMSPQLMAQYWQKMQQYFAMMQQSMAMGGAGRGVGMPMGMNPAMMQQMQQMQAMQAMQAANGGAMNPAMMQQMQAMQNSMSGNGMGGGGMGMGMGGPSNPGGVSGSPGYNAYEQQMFEQQKYEQQSKQRQQQFHQGGNFGGPGAPTSWEGMYDDVPQPNISGAGRGGFNNHRGGSQRGSVPPVSAPAAPAGAPTGPKNAGKPGANYRGGGRGGGRGGFHPYSRGG